MFRRLCLHAADFLVSALLVWIAVSICLVIFDTPKVDSFAASHVKRTRFPNMENVWRDEDYSRYHINSFGLIGDDPAPIDAADIYRIAVFGDSFVEAAQVSPKENFLGLLQKMLKVASRQQVELWNFGVAGDNTGNEFARWVYRPKGYRFNQVIFTFNDGDMYENTPDDDPGGNSAFLIPTDSGGFRLDESHMPAPIGEHEAFEKKTFGRFFYSTFRVRTRSQEWIEGRKAKLSALFADPAEQSRPILFDPARRTNRLANITYHQLVFVQQELSRAGVKCLLVGLPTSRISVPSDSEYDPERRAAYAKLSMLLRDANIPFVDMLPIVQSVVERGGDPYGDWEPGGHFNREGHRLIAAAIATALEDSATTTPIKNDNVIQ